MKFYICDKCGNIVMKLVDSGAELICCGQPMRELTANTSDGANEKHLPVIKAEQNKVTVTISTVEHPMLEAHYITWIGLETTKGWHKLDLKPNQKPEAVFYLGEDEKVIAAYEYCNLHGLWKTTV